MMWNYELNKKMAALTEMLNAAMKNYAKYFAEENTMGEELIEELENLTPKQALMLAHEAFGVVSDWCQFEEGIETDEFGFLQVYEIRNALQAAINRMED